MMVLFRRRLRNRPVFRDGMLSGICRLGIRHISWYRLGSVLRLDTRCRLLRRNGLLNRHLLSSSFTHRLSSRGRLGTGRRSNLNSRYRLNTLRLSDRPVFGFSGDSRTGFVGNGLLRHRPGNNRFGSPNNQPGSPRNRFSDGGQSHGNSLGCRMGPAASQAGTAAPRLFFLSGDLYVFAGNRLGTGFSGNFLGRLPRMFAGNLRVSHGPIHANTSVRVVHANTSLRIVHASPGILHIFPGIGSVSAFYGPLTRSFFRSGLEATIRNDVFYRGNDGAHPCSGERGEG